MNQKLCPYGKILNPVSNRCVLITGSIGKKLLQPVNKPIIDIINKPITYNVTENDVITDPAGLHYMKSSFSGAAGASHKIYSLLNKDKPNANVIKHFSQFKNRDALYEHNFENKSVAIFSKYNIKVIHAIGPDFTSSKYLKSLLDTEDELYNIFFKLYKDIYKAFYLQYKKNNNLHLRLLPISTGIFINNDPKYKKKLFKIFLRIYLILNKKYKITPTIYLFDKDDYKLFKSF
jgi:hypothetical protein